MFTITIATENAAFEYDKAAAVNELLRKVIRELGAGHTEGAVMDLNGNKVGSYELADEPGGAKWYAANPRGHSTRICVGALHRDCLPLDDGFAAYTETR